LEEYWHELRMKLRLDPRSIAMRGESAERKEEDYFPAAHIFLLLAVIQPSGIKQNFPLV
jgi:hypothetical protein